MWTKHFKQFLGFFYLTAEENRPKSEHFENIHPLEY